MFVPIGLFLAKSVGKSVSPALARGIGIGVLVLAAVVGFLIWLAVHDSNLIEGHDAEQDAEINAAVIEADRTATAAQEARDDGFFNSQGNVTAGISNAVAAAPVEARKPVGPASQSYYDTLRREQQAKQGNK